MKNEQVKDNKLYSEKKQKYYNTTIILESTVGENDKQKVNFKLDFFIR